jgi:hypothetical protein
MEIGTVSNKWKTLFPDIVLLAKEMLVKKSKIFQSMIYPYNFELTTKLK